MIETSCACGRRITVQDSHAGKRIRCSACGKPVSIPSLVPASSPNQAAAPVAMVPGPNPWKWIALGGLSLGAVSIVLSVVLLLRKPEPPPPRDTSEVDRHQQQMKAKEVELSEARARGDRERRDRDEEYRRRIDAESEIRKLREEIAREREENEKLLASMKEESSKVEVEEPKPEKTPERDPSIAELVEKHGIAVVVIKTDVGSGAGFFVSPDGLVATNYHVIAGSRRVTVEFNFVENGASRRMALDSRVCAVDLVNDLALVQVPTRTVPYLEVASDVDSRVGDTVVAIGSPGVGGKILENTVSSGIISALSREIDGVVYLQVTAPINPGNSGGPLLSLNGKLIGIVTAKARDAENIGFAVPASALRMVLDHKDGLYRISGSLTEWEAKNGLQFKHDTSKGIPIEGGVIRMAFFEDDKKLLALDYTNNSLVFVSMDTRKVLKSVYTGSEPVDFEFATHMRDVWVANSSAHNVVRVSLSRMQVMEKLELPFAPLDIACSKSHVWIRTTDDRLYVLSPTDKKAYYTQLGAKSIGFDTRHGRLLIGGGTILGEGEADKIAGVAKELAAAKKDADRAKLLEQYDKLIKVSPVNVSSPGYSGRGASLVVDSTNGRVYYFRAVFKADKLDAPLGVFKPNPYSSSSDPAVRAFMARYPLLDEIRAASPDGKWAANGTHVFNTQKYTVQQELPIPAIAYCFSKDSKALYFFDAINGMILPLALEK